MKKRAVIAVTLLILLSTIIPQLKIQLIKFNIKKINIENNFLIKKKDLENSLEPLINKNLLLLKNNEIEQLLEKNSLIKSFKIKKKYPDTLKIQIIEKKPIAILFNKTQKFYLSEKIDLIDFDNLFELEDLPYVFGNQHEFKIFYNNLVNIRFPFNHVIKYTFYETKRWDIETIDKKIIKLPSKDYIKSIESYLTIKNKKEFKKYKVFDYRIANQLILK